MVNRSFVLLFKLQQWGLCMVQAAQKLAPDNVRQALKLIDFYPQIARLIRDYSVERIMNHSGRKDLLLHEVANWDDFCYGSHMSIILVAGKDLRVLYKVHFKVKDFLGEFPGITNKAQLFDYFREYCNLMAGCIKKDLRAQNYVCGISLPTITSGYDEIIFSDPIRDERYIDCFAIGTETSRFVVTAHVETNNLELLKDLNNCPIPEKAEEGEIEFM
jgi:hypothetical protein